MSAGLNAGVDAFKQLVAELDRMDLAAGEATVERDHAAMTQLVLDAMTRCAREQDAAVREGFARAVVHLIRDDLAGGSGGLQLIREWNPLTETGGERVLLAADPASPTAGIPTEEDYSAGRDLAWRYIRAAITDADDPANGVNRDDTPMYYSVGILRRFIEELQRRPQLVDGFDAYLTSIVCILEHSVPILDEPGLDWQEVYGWRGARVAGAAPIAAAPFGAQVFFKLLQQLKQAPEVARFGVEDGDYDFHGHQQRILAAMVDGGGLAVMHRERAEGFAAGMAYVLGHTVNDLFPDLGQPADDAAKALSEVAAAEAGKPVAAD